MIKNYIIGFKKKKNDVKKTGKPKMYGTEK